MKPVKLERNKELQEESVGWILFETESNLCPTVWLWVEHSERLWAKVRNQKESCMDIVSTFTFESSGLQLACKFYSIVMRI